MAGNCARRVNVDIKKIFFLERALEQGRGLMGTMVLGQHLDSMTSEVFSNLNDSKSFRSHINPEHDLQHSQGSTDTDPY